MQIYAKPIRLLMRDMVSAFGLKPGQPFTRQQAVDWFAKNFPKIKRGSVTAHLVRLSVNAPARHHYSPIPGEDDLFFQVDSKHFRLYDTTYDQPASMGTKAAQSKASIDDDPEAEASTEFAYESDLRDYLAKNLGLIEPGLTLYEDEDVKGLEYPVGGRFIDILATDLKGGLLVVELKVSRGYDRVVGQLLRYMAWIQKNLAEPAQVVRGAIVAREISEDLQLACSLIPGVILLEYELSLKLKHVNEGG
jgi:endonuclease